MTTPDPMPGERFGQAMRAKITNSVVLQLARRTSWLESEMLGLSDLVTPGSVCIDIGAAAGLYTLALSRLAGPSGQVHSVEPLSIARPLWTRVLGARSRRNVHHHTLALGSEPGSGVMSVPVGRYGAVTGRSFLEARSHGLGSNAEFSGHKDVQVDVDTLDGLCALAGLENVSFVKIDVEGAELHVLEGGQRTIKASQPVLLVEIEARHLERYDYGPDDIVQWLASRGYVMHSWRQGWQQTSRVDEQTRNYMFRVPAAP